MSKKKDDKTVRDEESTASSAPSSVEETAASAVAVEDTTDWKTYAMRAQAEFENTKKRLAQQQAQALERASERVIEQLIPVMDDLEYGIAHAREAGNELADGMDAIRAKLVAVFAAEGVEVLDPTGEPFDHNTMNAVQMVSDAEKPDQTVAQTLQKGYVLGKQGRVVRPAMVVVTTQ